MGRAPKLGCCGAVFSSSPIAETGEKTCLRTHKTISITCFDVNPKTGAAFGSCVVCVPKNRKQQNKYFGTDNGKAKRKIQNSKETIKKMKIDWKTSATGKAKIKEYTSSDKFLKKCRDFSKTPNGKAIRKKSYQKHKFSISLLQKFWYIIKGGDSPKTIALSSFRSAVHVRNHFRARIAGPSMKMSNYGKVWQCDHKIPRSAYNHDDPMDVKRCWSPENMQPVLCKENREKHVAIVKDIVETVPKEMWPASWCGVMPCA